MNDQNIKEFAGKFAILDKDGNIIPWEPTETQRLLLKECEKAELKISQERITVLKDTGALIPKR